MMLLVMLPFQTAAHRGGLRSATPMLVRVVSSACIVISSHLNVRKHCRLLAQAESVACFRPGLVVAKRHRCADRSV